MRHIGFTFLLFDFGYTGFAIATFQIFLVFSTVIRSNGLKLIISRSHLRIRQNFYIAKVVKIWNDLPSEMATATIASFKHRLNQSQIVSNSHRNFRCGFKFARPLGRVCRIHSCHFAWLPALYYFAVLFVYLFSLCILLVNAYFCSVYLALEVWCETFSHRERNKIDWQIENFK